MESKNEKKPCEGLLEHIANILCISCLSDLHTPYYYPKAIEILRDIPDGDFDLAQWNETVSYITRQPVCENSPQAAKSKAADKQQIWNK